MKKLLSAIFIAAVSSVTQAQQLDLATCIREVYKNYPLQKQKNLEGEMSTISKALNKSAWLPQLSLNGQGSYQSDVTSLNGAGNGIERLSKDQYKAYIDVNQTLYDDGVISIKNDLQQLSAQINNSRVDTELRNVVFQTQQYFFNALVAQQDMLVYLATQAEIRARIKVLEAGVKYGTVKESQVDILLVEMLDIDQKIVEIQSNKKESLAMIALFSGIPLDENIVLILPDEFTLVANDFGKRPEYATFEFQKETFKKNLSLTNTRLKPQLSLFGQGGYGKPGLNQLKNEFETFYIVGAKLNWNLSSFYNLKKNKRLVQVEEQTIEVQQEVLDYQLKSQKISLDEKIIQLNKLIETDKAIVDLRGKISKVALAELDNGISTATDYLTEKNAEIGAKLALNVHQIQKIATQYHIKNLTGN